MMNERDLERYYGKLEMVLKALNGYGSYENPVPQYSFFELLADWANVPVEAVSALSDLQEMLDPEEVLAHATMTKEDPELFKKVAIVTYVRQHISSFFSEIARYGYDEAVAMYTRMIQEKHIRLDYERTMWLLTYYVKDYIDRLDYAVNFSHLPYDVFANGLGLSYIDEETFEKLRKKLLK